MRVVIPVNKSRGRVRVVSKTNSSRRRMGSHKKRPVMRLVRIILARGTKTLWGATETRRYSSQDRTRVSRMAVAEMATAMPKIPHPNQVTEKTASKELKMAAKK